ncbi:MAG: hypothetical protein KDA58_07425 [Planctomycetaceae bacterium]|nr:hypothetical protein [Planctomycetaceae bacterium]
MSDLEILNTIEIASPCDADWNVMEGDDRSRMCVLCQKRVYDLSTMTSQAAIDLIRQQEGQMCIRLFRRSDGTVINQDCPVGLRQVWRSTKRLAGAIGVGILVILGAFVAPSLVNAQNNGRAGKASLSFKQLYTDLHEWLFPSPPLMGDICIAPPAAPPQLAPSTPPDVPEPERLPTEVAN